MTLPNAFDYSDARPDPTAMAAAGIDVVSRYLFNSEKGLTDSERQALHAAGIGVICNFEALPGNALLGMSQGIEDGQAARAIARSLGVPKGTPIYFSVDTEILTGADMAKVIAYLHGADNDDYPSRPYGQKAVVDAWYKATKRPGWQTVAWSGGRISRHACFYQYEINQTWNGSAVDYDRVLKKDKLGAWWPAGKPNPEEPKVSILHTIRVLRGAVLGGRYATKKLRNEYPTMVRKQGLRDQVDGLESAKLQIDKAINDVVTRVTALEKK